MGKPIERSFDQSKGILKFFPYKGTACVVPTTLGVEQDNGYTVAKAGTPYPSNDANCLGYLLHDVDVTNGEAMGTYVYEGTIDTDKLTENSITVTDLAKTATPKVNFYGSPYTVVTE